MQERLIAAEVTRTSCTLVCRGGIKATRQRDRDAFVSD